MLSDDAGRFRWWLVPCAALFVDLTVIALVQPRWPVRDEVVFFPAAQAFLRAGRVPSLDFLRSYPAPQTPLSFYLAGRVLALAPSLTLLRLVNCGLMFAALLRFARFVADSCGKRASVAVTVIALNPYVHLAATHFYTDALYFLLVVVVVTRRPSSPAWVSLALLPLTRQLGMSFALAEALHGVRIRHMRLAILALCTWLPTLALFALWRSPFPNTATALVARNVHDVYGWFFPYVAVYHVAALGFYLSPVLLYIDRTPRFWLGVVVGATSYLAAPAHPNFSAQLSESGVMTLGYFHRATLLLGPLGSHALLCVFAGVGGGLIAHALTARSPLRYFVGLFVVFSVFNTQAWDKYLLDVLPAALLAVLSVPEGASRPSAHEA